MFTTYLPGILNNMPVSTQWRTFLSYLRQDYSNRTTHPSSIEVVNAIREENWAQHKDDPEAFPTIFAAKFEAENKRKQSFEVEGVTEGQPATKRQREDETRGDRLQMCTVKDCDRQRGHPAEECFSYGGGKAGQYPPWYRGPRDIHLPKAERAPQRPGTT